MEHVEWIDWLSGPSAMEYARSKIQNELGDEYTTVLTFDGRIGILKKERA